MNGEEKLQNINFITCSKEIYRYTAHALKIDPLPSFFKSLKRDNTYKLCLRILEEHICIVLSWAMTLTLV